MIENLLFAGGIILAGLFCVWVLWSYKSRMKEAKTLVTVFLMIAALPLGIRLAMERTRSFTQAYEEPAVIDVQVRPDDKTKTTTAYVTLSEAAYLYGKLAKPDGDTIDVFSTGQVEPRIGHSLIMENVEKGSTLTLFINGMKVDKQVEVN